jgi:hypothetical protein
MILSRSWMSIYRIHPVNAAVSRLRDLRVSG